MDLLYLARNLNQRLITFSAFRCEEGVRGGRMGRANGEGELEGREEGKKKAALGVGQLSGVYLLDMGISGIICSKRSFF